MVEMYAFTLIEYEMCWMNKENKGMGGMKSGLWKI